MSTSENREAALIAKITAGTTHEILNVLAIVKESAGLIEDLVRLFEERGSLNKDKLMRAVSRIEAQVSRGAELMSNLNRFAHSLDHTQDRIDLNQEVQQVALLCQRFAKQKNHRVQVLPGDPDLTVVLNSLRLQMALFAAVECCLEHLPEAGKVSLRTGRQGERPSVEFIGEVGDEAVSIVPTEASGWSGLAELLDSLGASVEAVDAARGFRLVLPG